jgi:hypothetical protein
MTDFVTVADMMAALSALPADARLVVTHSGYYAYDDYGDCFVPRLVADDEFIDGTPLFAIGHSHQSY